MALPAALEADLRAALRSFRAAGGITSVPGGSGKALEAWLLMKLAESTRSAPGWLVSLRRGDGLPLPAGAAFRFPAGQSGILPANTSAPGFVLLEYIADPLRNLELHSGLRWRGRSGATHECDVSALPARIATTLRRHGGGEPEGLPVAAFECKDKITWGTTDEMRQTLARLFDLALVTQPNNAWACRIWEPKTNSKWGRRSSKYVSFFARGAFGVVRVGPFQSGALQLGRHYSIRQYGEIYDPAGATIASVTAAMLRILREIDDF